MKRQSKVEGQALRVKHSGFRPPTLDARQVVEVSAGLIFRDGKLLITQRFADAHLGGLWEFPGGKREAEETFEQCLIRELHEELGVEVSVGMIFESVTHTYPEKTVHIKFFHCELIRGEPKPIGCTAIQWINRAELTKHEFSAADARLLEKLRKSTRLWD